MGAKEKKSGKELSVGSEGEKPVLEPSTLAHIRSVHKHTRTHTLT